MGLAHAGEPPRCFSLRYAAGHLRAATWPCDGAAIDPLVLKQQSVRTDKKARLQRCRRAFSLAPHKGILRAKREDPFPMLHVHQFPCLSDNYGYLLHNSVTGETAAIDTPDATEYLNQAKAKGWTITHIWNTHWHPCLLYTSPSPRDLSTSRMPSSA